MSEVANKQEVDLESLSLEEIRRLAAEEAAEPEATEPEEPETPAAEPDQAEPTPHRRVIDLGDGSGTQVFEAATLEELADKLAEAQKHATKKIRDQQQQLRKEAEKPKEEPQLSEDDEFVLSQELLTKPTAAFKKMFKQMTGYELSDFKTKMERAEVLERAFRENQASVDFVTTHPDYVGNEANGQKMENWLKTFRNGEITPENLQAAYDDLKKSGLLQLKSPEAAKGNDVVDEPTGAANPRIADAEGSVPTQRRRASGLPSRGRVTPPVKSAEPSEEELYSMPLDKLRELGNKQLRNQ